MTLTHHYDNSSGRRIFRLRDFETRPNHGFDLERPTPEGYEALTAGEKLSVAEFTVFLIARREDADGAKRDEFYVRDHDNRPITTQHEIPADTPARYAELSEEERFHMHEFIQFLGKIHESTEA